LEIGEAVKRGAEKRGKKRGTVLFSGKWEQAPFSLRKNEPVPTTDPISHFKNIFAKYFH
jgi:hypothetical protein